MASFCKYCSIVVFGDDYQDFHGLCEPGQMAGVLCEGCGPCWVDHEGKCVQCTMPTLHASSKMVAEWEKWEKRLKGPWRRFWELFDTPMGPGRIGYWKHRYLVWRHGDGLDEWDYLPTPGRPIDSDEQYCSDQPADQTDGHRTTDDQL